jgi:DNA-binding CsgD family transcriptional regulator
MPSGRPRKFSKEEFLALSKQHNHMPALAQALGVTIPTAYNYMRRFKLDLPGNIGGREFRRRLLRLWKGRISLAQLAKRLDKSEASIRYHMRLYIARAWRKPRQYPMPNTPHELKIARTLRKAPALYDDPPRLAQRLNIPLAEVQVYLQRIFAHTSKRSA